MHSMTNSISKSHFSSNTK